MLVKDGKNLIRDLISGGTAGVYFDKGGLGTVSTSPSESDTGLNNNANMGTLIKSLTKTITDKQIIFDYSINSTEGTGITFTEFGFSSSGATKLLNRQTFWDLAKGTIEEWQFSGAVSIK